MEKIAFYRATLQKVLLNYAAEGVKSTQPITVETQLVFDTERDTYQVTRVGWQDRRQIFGVIFYFNIRNDKIWLQHHASDYDIIADLEEKGVPKEDIVLAFHSPAMRPYTGYAVA